MDWTQASWFETSSFAVGALVLFLLAVLVISTVLYCAYAFARKKITRIMRLKKTTRALRCEVCEHEIENDGLKRCDRFDVSITFAPVMNPGCTWGIERSEEDNG